mmetsp:Transcript_27395/g.49614  ORF Transcript_27395/g.49614 Transcript_27395/m.49614 type:complete len:225 (+) Transcript_27395:803-1477(+)
MPSWTSVIRIRRRSCLSARSSKSSFLTTGTAMMSPTQRMMVQLQLDGRSEQRARQHKNVSERRPLPRRRRRLSSPGLRRRRSQRTRTRSLKQHAAAVRPSAESPQLRQNELPQLRKVQRSCQKHQMEMLRLAVMQRFRERRVKSNRKRQQRRRQQPAKTGAASRREIRTAKNRRTPRMPSHRNPKPPKLMELTTQRVKWHQALRLVELSTGLPSAMPPCLSHST